MECVLILRIVVIVKSHHPHPPLLPTAGMPPKLSVGARGLGFCTVRVVVLWEQLNSILFYIFRCAGVCRFKGRRDRSGRGIGEVTISLSEPLLKLRPRSDLVNTLLVSNIWSKSKQCVYVTVKVR
jgi:hypothetical protein